MNMLTAHVPVRLVGPTILLSFLAFSGEPKLKESDHKNLSKWVSGYFTALSEEKGIFEALTKVLDQVESTEKKMKGAKLLAAVADWEQVFRLVTADRIKETLKKKGEVTAEKRKAENGIELTFAYCTPKKAPKGPLPLLLIACDSGEAPSAHLNTHWNDAALREGAVLMAIDLGKDTQSWGVFGSSTDRKSVV